VAFGTFITAEMTGASGNLATNLIRTGISGGFLATQEQQKNLTARGINYRGKKGLARFL